MPEKNYLPSSGKINLNNINNREDPFSNPNTQTPVVNPNIVETPPVQEVHEDTPAEVVVPEPEVQPAAIDNVPPEDPTMRRFEGVSQRALGIAAIAIGLLIIGGGFIAYKYFTRDDAQLRNIPTAEVQIDEGDSNGMVNDLNGRIAGGVSTSRAEDWEVPGDSAGIVQTNSNTGRGERSDSSSIAEVPRAQAPQNTTPQVKATSTSAWKANNYAKGDIKAGSYSVVRGDTLWEISEAVYGSGSQWQKIATANNVSYLSNGNPLILPGQVLNISS